MIQITKINKQLFSIKFNREKITNSFLILLKSIQGLSFFNKIINTLEIKINAFSVEKFTLENMNYEMSLEMIYCLSLQQKLLEKLGYSFFSFHPEDIIIINNKYFICINEKHLCLLKNDCFSLQIPFSKNNFCSPELMEVENIPNYSVNKLSFNYSLASFIYFCFFREKYRDRENYRDREKYREENKLENIKNTKLYWFFKNNLINDYYKRKIFMIYESYIL
jgi:hypothetical protein